MEAADPTEHASGPDRKKPTGPSDPGSETLDSRPRGFPTLKDYLARGPKLLEEQARAVEKLRKVEELMAKYEARHRALAQAYRANATQGASQARNLDSFPQTGPLAASRGAQPLSAPAAQPSPIEPNPAPVSVTVGMGHRIEKPVELPAPKLDEKYIANQEPARAPASVHSSEISEAAFYPVKAEKAAKAGAVAASTSSTGNDKSAAAGAAGKKAGEGFSLRDELRQRLAAQQALDRAQKAKKGEPESGKPEAVAALAPQPKSIASAEDVSTTPDFSMKGSETDAAIQRLAGEVGALSSLPGAESLGLFLRVHSAHERWKKQLP